MTQVQSHKFPNDPLLVRLLCAAKGFPNHDTAIHDVAGFEKLYSDLLGDIMRTRDFLHAQLPATSLNDDGIIYKESQYIAILARSGYEFIVAFFAIRAIGGVCVPLASGILPIEAAYFVEKVSLACLLVSEALSEKAAEICATCGEQGKPTLLTVPISSEAGPIDCQSVGIHEAILMEPSGAGVVMFTSGTTGRPKGVLLPRRCFAYERLAEPGSAAISYRPGHWLGGASSMLGTVVTGKKLYILGEKADAGAILDVFRKYHITEATFSPLWLRQIQVLLQRHKDQTSNDLQKEVNYSAYFKGLSSIRCSASTVEPSTLKFWTDMTSLPFENVYASTELGGATMRCVSRDKGAIGVPMPGIKVKLSNGTTGEIRVKSPTMIIRYIGDDESTKSMFDEEGYFKTGDLGELRGGEYFFTGRENTDYMTFGSYKISTLVVESSLLDLPYVSEACVLGVPDHSAKHLCAAVVRLTPDAASSGPVSIARIRSDIRNGLSEYMLPTLLRILVDGEELPRTVSGKYIKRQILSEYFGAIGGVPAKIASPGVERFKLSKMADGGTRPWDWCGMQCAN